MLKNCQTYFKVRFLNCVCPFSNITHEEVKNLSSLQSNKSTIKNFANGARKLDKKEKNSYRTFRQIPVLTLIWVGFLGVRFEVCVCQRGGSGTCQKREIWYICTHTYVISENIPFTTRTSLILLMPAFFSEKSTYFWQKQYVYSRSYHKL